MAPPLDPLLAMQVCDYDPRIETNINAGFLLPGSATECHIKNNNENDAQWYTCTCTSYSVKPMNTKRD